MDEVPDEINIVTLNCWGLKYISKLRRERLTEIGRQLAVADPPPHIVALQECWTQEDYKSIRRETRFVLPYGKFYRSGALGSGLAILFAIAAIVTPSWWFLLAAVVSGSFFAWISHFFIEHNKPATFTYPLWSLRGDFRMFRLTLAGRMGPELERAAQLFAARI